MVRHLVRASWMVAVIIICHTGFFFFLVLVLFYLFYFLIFFKKLFIYLFILGCVGSPFLWGLSPVAASGGHSSSRCAGLSLSRPLLLRSTGSRRAGSAGVAHGPSCSAACGIFPDQGSNPCPLHRQADSQPLRHQGSPIQHLFNVAWHCYLFFMWRQDYIISPL